jgi:uncharacterized protein (DUF305 family)
MTRSARAAVGGMVIALAAACASAPMPAASPEPRDAAPVRDTVRRGYTAADVRFMQGMIAHHGQAVLMTSLVPGRTTRNDLRLIAQRIDVSQQDEIVMMQGWLRARGEEVPAADAGHHHHGGPMPGMLTPEEIARLTAASGAEFDRLFLEGMIRHHEGALTMVAELFGTPGAGQESQIYQFASDVDADQRAEIARMRGVLNR